MAAKFGLPILFLYPEYLGEVNFFSHLILGLSCGGFIMAYNISSYIINGFRFPFLATLSTPFFKYAVNNFIIPITFVLVYLYNLADFQLNSELVPAGKVIGHLMGFLLGNLITILISFGYFMLVNKNADGLLGQVRTKRMKPQKAVDSPVSGGLYRKEKWYRVFRLPREWKVVTYLAHPFKIGLARESEHYTKEMLQRVFAQNHINASLFEIGAILLVLVFGYFREYPLFLIPAGASIFLFFTMVLMIFSALHSWLRGWSTLVFIALALGINYLSQFPALNYFNYAYGLDYTAPKTEYSIARIRELNNDEERQQKDKAAGVNILENWKAQNPITVEKPGAKPKLLVLNTSGGGLRSAMWTFLSLQHADSLLDGQVMQHMHLITGSSGGMLGAAYLREVHLHAQSDSSIRLHDPIFARDMGRDILNPIALTLTVNDLFLRLQRFHDNGNTYTKDRGFAFEWQLNNNTRGWLDKRLKDYYEPERQAKVPLMLMAPAISNDGRRLLVSSQPVSYLTALPEKGPRAFQYAAESVEFSRLFQDAQPGMLKFTTALRMSATFPYVMPNVNLPTEPGIEVMDAGARDNLGWINTLLYLQTFQEWINENTSGVVILQIRDQSKEVAPFTDGGRSLASSLMSPLGNLYGNWLVIQDYQGDKMVELMHPGLGVPLEIVDLQLRQSGTDPISMSWHLTRQEKQKIREGLFTPQNQEAFERLARLLE